MADTHTCYVSIQIRKDETSQCVKMQGQQTANKPNKLFVCNMELWWQRLFFLIANGLGVFLILKLQYRLPLVPEVIQHYANLLKQIIALISVCSSTDVFIWYYVIALWYKAYCCEQKIMYNVWLDKETIANKTLMLEQSSKRDVLYTT